jgi:hypothetical protein
MRTFNITIYSPCCPKEFPGVGPEWAIEGSVINFTTLDGEKIVTSLPFLVEFSPEANASATATQS